VSADRPGILAQVEGYYSGKLREHGATPRGVDWSSAESQALRFEKLLEVCRGDPEPWINDYGCGYGALVDHLLASGRRFRYRGFDISAPMLEAARARHGGLPACEFVADEKALLPADYTLASGIFNVRLDVPDQDWSAHLEQALDRMHALSLKGFAFNALSLYSDPERRRPDLYYADPLALFDRCKRRFSRQVALLHDYPLWEFSILVRKG
jgi:SAM-dependent methyltransferase